METHAIFVLLILILNDLNISAVSSTEFYIKDILSNDLMPGSFLDITNSGRPKDDIEWNSGSFDVALSTMNFHRKMINEYLCRKLLAEEILSTFEVDLRRKQDRHGRPFSLSTPKFYVNQGLLTKKTNLKNPFLADAGSSSYKDWLTKTATFEDIYKHFKNAKDIGAVVTRNDGFATKDYIVAEGEEYDGGDITGYAYNPAPEFSGKVGYDDQPARAEGYEQHSHGMGLSDLFEISLTGLAFLSFGMFALQVIMCMTMNQNNQTIVMQSLINHGDPNDNIMNIDEVRRRSRRSTPVWEKWLEAEALNEMSRRVLISIKAVMVSTNDEGACLKKSICESNKYSKTLNDEQKFWIPLWNVGMSWASGAYGVDGSGSLRAVDALRAAALGLGGVQCRSAFATCNYTNLRRAGPETNAIPEKNKIKKVQT